ncbi:hypothetical protein [Aeromicrobium sp.]|uniref:hypothetical protein n=1 Tax=Aeromicrobium sp. TaxID=1871063 RepID=UPI0030BEF6CF
MPTLHIQHAINDFDVWTVAFARFAEFRKTSGVRDQHVRRPVDDEHYVVIDLDFGTVEEATTMLEFLRTKVWASPDKSPALEGSVDARVLEDVELS